jgi:hypothetical protein
MLQKNVACVNFFPNFFFVKITNLFPQIVKIGQRNDWNYLLLSVERLMHKKGIVERLEERHIAVPAAEAPPIPAAHEARRWRTAELMGGMWKVLALAAHQDAISVCLSLSSVSHTVKSCLGRTTLYFC